MKKAKFSMSVVVTEEDYDDKWWSNIGDEASYGVDDLEWEGEGEERKPKHTFENAIKIDKKYFQERDISLGDVSSDEESREVSDIYEED